MSDSRDKIEINPEFAKLFAESLTIALDKKINQSNARKQWWRNWFGGLSIAVIPVLLTYHLSTDPKPSNSQIYALCDLIEQQEPLPATFDPEAKKLLRECTAVSNKKQLKGSLVSRRQRRLSSSVDPNTQPVHP